MGVAFLAALMFAMSSITARRSVAVLGPPTANLYRIVIATVVLGIYTYGWGVGWGGVALGWFLVSGFVGYGIGDFGIFQALPLIGTRLTSLMTQCLAAPMAALMEWLWLGTTLGPVELGAGAGILLGVGLALAPEKGDESAQSALPWRGIVFGLVAALGQSGGAVLSRHGSVIAAAAGKPVDAGSVSFQRLVPGVLFAVAWWLVQYGRKKRVVRETGLHGKTKNIGVWVLANGLVGPCIGVVLYQRALQLEPTGMVLSIVALTPLLVIPLAIWLDGERPSVRSIFGGVVAVISAIILVRSKG